MSTKTKKESKKLGWVLLVTLVLGGIIFGLSQIGSTTSITNYAASSTAAVIETVVDEKDSKLDEIRSREEIRRQQELLVQETFLKEEKSRIQGEKEESIVDFDAQIAALEQKKQDAIDNYDSQIATKETELEQVRSEKIDFQ